MTRPAMDCRLEYWNAVADSYDHYYQHQWSRAEDACVGARIAREVRGRVASGPRVLDLACGTGYGYRLLTELFDDVDYHGIDLSPRMLTRLRENHPEISVSRGDMADLSGLPQQQFDLVTVFWTSASYVDDIRGLLLDVRRLLRVPGVAYLSVLGRTALRRLATGNVSTNDRYRTRCDDTGSAGVDAVHYRRGELKRIAQDAGFVIRCIDSQGTLAGLLELPWLWWFSRALDRTLPFLGHTYEVVLRAR